MRDFLIRLYFSPFGYLIHIFTKTLAILGFKCMVYGYIHKGKYYRRTRIASTAIITDKSKLKIGDNVWINHYSRIDASGGVCIKEGCQIGFGACILSHSTHNSIRLMGYEFMKYRNNERIGYISKPTFIGRYSFIGGGSFIMPGVNVGEGCIVGVNSVVTHDVPDYSIVVGSPAKIIGSTKDSDKIYLNDEINRTLYYLRFAAANRN